MGLIGSLLQGLLSIVLWFVGGWFIVRGAFNTARVEQVPLAFLLGLTLDAMLSNMLAQLLPIQVAFWLAPVLVLAIGLAMAWGSSWKVLITIPLFTGQVLALVAIAAIFTLAERGLAIFDDYALLPTLSVIASGSIPPRFPLNVEAAYDYHYLLMVFAAQLTRIAGLEIWKSIDASRAIVFSITVILAGVFGQRLTKSKTAGVVGAFFTALGMGTRWILLLFPPAVVNWLSGSVTMLGSAAESGASLSEALSRPWGVEGVGPVGFPFGFANGIFPPGILEMSSANSTFLTAISLFFLLTFNRWRGWRGALISALIVGSMALLTEFNLLVSLTSWAVIVVIYIVRAKSIRLPHSLLQWLVVVLLGNLLGLVQGGALTGTIAGLLSQVRGQAVISYHSVGFGLALEPALVSSHLGVLSLVRPSQMVLALIEFGPILIILPILAVWGLKAYRCKRWYEAAFILSAFLSLGTVFLRYTGSEGIRNTSRLYLFINICALYVVPLGWLWVAQRSERLKWAAGILTAAMMFGGVVLLSVKLVAIQRPVYSNFLTVLDVRMYDLYWNQLEPDALVFDPEIYRGPTIFGRATIGFNTWFEATPEWVALRTNPNPSSLSAAGFQYAYIDNRYWQEIGPQGQKALNSTCVKVVDEFFDAQENFRRLLDLEGCH